MSDSEFLNEFLNEKQAAEVLGVALNTLRGWRYNGTSRIPFYKIGHFIRFRRSDLLAWIEGHRRGDASKKTAP